MTRRYGMPPVAVPDICTKFPDWFPAVTDSGISAGCLATIALKVLSDHVPGRNPSVGTAREKAATPS